MPLCAAGPIGRAWLRSRPQLCAEAKTISPGSLAPDFVAAKTVTREKKKVGPLEKELEYAGATSAGAVRPKIAIID